MQGGDTVSGAVRSAPPSRSPPHHRRSPRRALIWKADAAAVATRSSRQRREAAMPFGAPAEPGGERTRGHERADELCKAQPCASLGGAQRFTRGGGACTDHVYVCTAAARRAESYRWGHAPISLTQAHRQGHPPLPSNHSAMEAPARKRVLRRACTRWLSPPGLSRSLGHNACGLLCVRCRASNVVLLRLSQLLWPRLRAPAPSVPAGLRPSCPMVPCARWRRPRAACAAIHLQGVWSGSSHQL